MEKLTLTMAEFHEFLVNNRPCRVISQDSAAQETSSMCAIGKTCFKIVQTSQESQGKRERSRGGPCSLILKPVFLIIVRFIYHFSVLSAGF